MANIRGTGAGENLIGTAETDLIHGEGGGDFIDALTVFPGGGSDLVDGGGGIDTLIVFARDETVGVQLIAAGTPSFQVRSDSGNFSVEAYSIERVQFTGGAGNDFINTGAAGGRVVGGAGIDHWVANLSTLTRDVAFELNGILNRVPTPAGGPLSIVGVEQITLITGSGEDRITGGAQGDTIATGARNDRIDPKTRVAGDSGDIVNGGAGIDTLVVDARRESAAVQLIAAGTPSFQVRSTSGNYFIEAYDVERVEFTGGSRDDFIDTGAAGGTINGGHGIDLWKANLGALTTRVVFTLDGTTTAIGAAGLTSILNLEQLELITGSGNDAITGGARGDDIATGAGDDRIDAGERRPASPIFDAVDGGAGTDTLIVDAHTETAAVRLIATGTPSFQVRSQSDRFFVEAYNIEKVEFVGGGGNDYIDSGAAAGRVNGGAGNDHWLADLRALAERVEFTLGTTSAIRAAGLSAIFGVEQITLATGSGNDEITGGGLGDEISTGLGDDTIDAGSRDRSIPFSLDLVDGGDGLDTLIVDARTETTTVRLIAAGTPSFQVRSDSGNYFVEAYNVEDVDFVGGSGNDVIDTGTAKGLVHGEDGLDLWKADLRALTTGIEFILGTTGSVGAAGLISIADVELIDLSTGSGNDKITGGTLHDRIFTGNGNDRIDARTRVSSLDYVDGGAGADTLVVDAKLETGGVQLTAADTPSLQVRSDSGHFRVDAYNIERVEFTGGIGPDIAAGLAGNDRLIGGAGRDRLTGGLGADQLTGGADDDIFDYNSIADSRPGSPDTITDLGDDRIDLADIDANVRVAGDQAFTFIGRAAFSGTAGELRAVAGRIEADVNGNGSADFLVRLTGDAIAGPGDFIL